MREKILVFIPMYNCEKQIVRVLGQLEGRISRYITEVLVVNNRSTDRGEDAVIEAAGKMRTGYPIKLMRNRENYGLGGSHKAAFRYAVENGFDYLIVLHGDDQGCINDLLPILKKGIYKKYDCCLGSRFLKGSLLEGYSRFRTFGNAVFNLIFTVSLHRRIYDLGAGLNLYSVKMLKTGFYQKFPDDLTFNCYMLFALAAYRQKYIFFPITWREEDQVSNVKMASQAWKTLKMAVSFAIAGERFLIKDAGKKKFREYQSDIIFKKEAGV